jgi:hypothetical protein
MVVKNKAEIERIQIEIQEKLVKRRNLKSALTENDNALQALENYLAYLVGKPVSEISVRKSIPDHLEAILRANGSPMKANDLWIAVSEIDGLENTALQTITGALIRYVNKGKRFTRTGPNTYYVMEDNKD